MSNLDFKGVYRRNLPHLQQPGASLFVTFRLDGSLPAAVVEQWKQERAWLQKLALQNPQVFESLNLQFQRKWFGKFERLLDSGSHGPLYLKEKGIAAVVAESLHYRDSKVYRLDCFSIMPNHVHSVFKPLPLSETIGFGEFDVRRCYHPLGSIMHSLKGYTAFKCNRLLGRKGQFWAHESYDHCVRNAEEWTRIVAYVLNNPVKAGFVKHWTDWPWTYLRKRK